MKAKKQDTSLPFYIRVIEIYVAFTSYLIEYWIVGFSLLDCSKEMLIDGFFYLKPLVHSLGQIPWGRRGHLFRNFIDWYCRIGGFSVITLPFCFLLLLSFVSMNFILVYYVEI